MDAQKLFIYSLCLGCFQFGFFFFFGHGVLWDLINISGSRD